jgi:ssRNA-specific RNase YbeY (16S rRNA maturation enzyme)
MRVNFFNESDCMVRQYEKIIKNVFKTIGGKKEFNVIFVNKDEIQRINKE